VSNSSTLHDFPRSVRAQTKIADLIGKTQQHAQEACEVHLSGSEFSTPGVVSAIQRRGTVHHEQSIATDTQHVEQWCDKVTKQYLSHYSTNDSTCIALFKCITRV